MVLEENRSHWFVCMPCYDELKNRSEKGRIMEKSEAFTLPVAQMKTSLYGVEIRPLIKEEFVEASGVLAEAFQNDPAVMAIFRGLPTESRIKRLEVMFLLGLVACAQRSTPLTIALDDKTVGVAILHHPGAFPLPLVTQLSMVVKAVTRNGFQGVRRYMSWANGIHRHHRNEPHYYIESIGVDAEQQGKNLGSQLLGRITEMADVEEVGCFLETANPMNLALYERFGFQVVAQQHVIEVPTWFMWRARK